MQPTPLPSRPTVLVVEDDALIQEMAADALEDAGFEVIAVTAAEDALGLALMDVGFDAVFTDINLAGVLDGWELAETLREMRPELPVVYTSGDAQTGAAAARVCDSLFVPKPYNPVALCELMKGIVTPRRHVRVPESPVRDARVPESAEHMPRKAELRLIA